MGNADERRRKRTSNEALYRDVVHLLGLDYVASLGSHHNHLNGVKIMSRNSKPTGVPYDQIGKQTLMDVMPSDWDKKPLSLAYEIEGFLQTVKDEGTAIDSGTNGVTGDLWVTVQGVEYFITIAKSRGQLAKEGRLPPPRS